MRRLFIVAITVAVIVEPLAAVSRAAPRSDPEAVLTLEGRGWGHGRGMGQWGARAMAEAGRSWRQIAGHYYRGARIARRPDGERIRVLLATPRALTVTSDAPFTLSAGGRKRTARAKELYRIRRSGRALVVERAGGDAGPWRVVTKAARVSYRPGRSMLGVVGRKAIRSYRGTLVVRPAGARAVRAVLSLPLEQYLSGVVPREMPAAWPMEALKAQATAARTYAVRVKGRARARDRSYDICATTRCQVFGGSTIRKRSGTEIVRLEHPRTGAAIRATRGHVLVYRGTPILAQYASSTGGHTASGGVPYLAPVRDPWDRKSPYHLWSQEVEASAVEREWPSIGGLTGVRVLARDGRGDWGGRARAVLVRGKKRSVRVSGAAFRSALGLRSDWFRVVSLARPSSTSRYRFTFDMGVGTRHVAVSHLQRRLRAERLYPADTPITGYFGTVTRDALRRYQRAHGIRATGYLGPITRRALNRTR